MSLPESKYMFKNIEKKQKLIDERHRRLQDGNIDDESKSKNKSSKASTKNQDNEVLFTSKFMNELTVLNERSSLLRETSS